MSATIYLINHSYAINIKSGQAKNREMVGGSIIYNAYIYLESHWGDDIPRMGIICQHVKEKKAKLKNINRGVNGWGRQRSTCVPMFEVFY